MNILESQKDIENLIKENQMVLIYFGSEDCGVCNVIKPKVEEILRSYPNIKSAEVNVEKVFDISAAYNIFTIPGILLFIDGKETIREARYINIEDIQNGISRYHSLLFD